MSDSSPLAGWYADPEDPASERWWNGVGWSDSRRPSTVADAGAPAVPAAPLAAPAPVEPATAGFTFGSPAAAGRPDPYAPPAPYTAAPYSASPYTASPYVAPYGAPAPATNGLAIGGLIASIAGLLLGVLPAVAGIILSAFAISQSRKRHAAGLPDGGRGLATAGLAIGIVALVVQGLIVVLYFVFLLSIGYPS